MRVDRGFFCAAVSTKVDTHQQQLDPPRHPTECQLLLLPLPLPLLRQVQGCKPCRTHSPHTTGMLCCPRFRYGGVDMIISASE